MRIIAGTARGVQLASPGDKRVRPTLDRVRESLFNILAFNIPGSRFLDLYAGTGANGLEALSRGASLAVFIDNDKQCIKLIHENAARTKLSAASLCITGTLPDALEKLTGMEEQPFNIIFADPPYAQLDFIKLLESLKRGNVLASNGNIIIEHDAHLDPPDESTAFQCTRSIQYGDTRLSFFS